MPPAAERVLLVVHLWMTLVLLSLTSLMVGVLPWWVIGPWFIGLVAALRYGARRSEAEAARAGDAHPGSEPDG